MTPGLIILTPTRETLTNEMKVAIKQNLDGFDYVHLVEVGLPVVEARNRLWLRAQAVSREHPNWLILHIDDDAYWEAGTLSAYIDRIMPCPLFTANAYFSRRAPSYGSPHPSALPEFFLHEVIAPFFFVHHPSLFYHLGPHPWSVLSQDEIPRESESYRLQCENWPNHLPEEDLAFWVRVARTGFANIVLPRSVVWHVDERAGVMWAPGQDPHIFRDNRAVPCDEFPSIGYEFRTYGLSYSVLEDPATLEFIERRLTKQHALAKKIFELRREERLLESKCDQLKAEMRARDMRNSVKLSRWLMGAHIQAR